MFKPLLIMSPQVRCNTIGTVYINHKVNICQQHLHRKQVNHLSSHTSTRQDIWPHNTDYYIKTVFMLVVYIFIR